LGEKELWDGWNKYERNIRDSLGDGREIDCKKRW
jgi:hypothetical protein